MKALERKNKRVSWVILETRRALTAKSENKHLHDSAEKSYRQERKDKISYTGF